MADGEGKDKDAIFRIMDVNDDGGVSLVEWMYAFQTLDIDKKGVISRETWIARQGDATVFDAVAGAEVGQLTKKEWINAYSRLDKNHDGAITIKEWQESTGSKNGGPRRASIPGGDGLRTMLLTMIGNEPVDQEQKQQNTFGHLKGVEERAIQIIKDCGSSSARPSAVAMQDTNGTFAEEGGPQGSGDKDNSKSWTLERWLESLRSPKNGSFAELIASKLSKKFDEGGQLAFLKTIGSDGNIEVTSCLLLKVGVLEGLAEIIIHGANDLLKVSAKRNEELCGKYIQEPGTLRPYSTLDTVPDDLEALVGAPDASLLQGMWREHCQQADSSDRWITRRHQITTTPILEWAFVVDPDGGPEACADPAGVAAPTMRGSASLPESVSRGPSIKLPTEKTQPILGAKDRATTTAKKLALPSSRDTTRKSLSSSTAKAEEAALNSMMTSASSSVGVSEEYHRRPTYAAFQDFCREKRTAAKNGEMGQQWASVTWWPQGSSTGSSSSGRARMPQRLPEFRDEFDRINALLARRNTTPLMVEELIAARLYTGPMFEKYNVALQRCTRSPNMETKFEEFCKGNGYITSLHVISSGIGKLSKALPVTTVYRNLRGGVLSPACWDCNDFKFRGGVEFGFLSATADKAVTMSHAAAEAEEEGAGTIFEIQSGGGHNGADLAWLSQYPHEEEVCFGPLVGLQIQRTRVDASVLIIEVEMQVKPTLTSVERLSTKRAQLLGDVFKCLGLENKAFLNRWKAEEAVLRERGIIEDELKSIVDARFQTAQQCGLEDCMSDAKLKTSLVSALDAHTWLAGAGALETPYDILTLIRVEGMQCPDNHEMKRQPSMAVRPDCHRCGEKFPQGTCFSMCKVGHIYRVCPECIIQDYNIGEPAKGGIFSSMWMSADQGCHDLDEDIISGVLRLRASGESLEPITRLLAARFLHADVLEEAGVRYFAHKALAAIFAGRDGLLECLWQPEAGGGAALEVAFPGWLIHGAFKLGTREIEPQTLKVLCKQDGMSPAALREFAELGDADVSKLVRLGLKAKKDKWTIGEEIAVDGERCLFCVVQKVEENEVHAEGLLFNATTGAGMNAGGAPPRAFALEWS